jgi:hypothetical protein
MTGCTVGAANGTAGITGCAIVTAGITGCTAGAANGTAGITGCTVVTAGEKGGAGGGRSPSLACRSANWRSLISSSGYISLHHPIAVAR